MGRQVKRVPVGFGWPRGKTWPGYLLPDWLEEERCSACDGGGWSLRAQELYNRWYGNAPFRPEDNGSTPLTADTPEVRELARHNAHYARDLVGCNEDREAQRLADGRRVRGLATSGWPVGGEGFGDRRVGDEDGPALGRHPVERKRAAQDRQAV